MDEGKERKKMEGGCKRRDGGRKNREEEERNELRHTVYRKTFQKEEKDEGE